MDVVWFVGYVGWVGCGWWYNEENVGMKEVVGDVEVVIEGLDVWKIDVEEVVMVGNEEI